MKKEDKLNVGLFGVGLQAYWKQFDGIKEELESYLDSVRRSDVDIIFPIYNYLCFVFNRFTHCSRSKSITVKITTDKIFY